MGNPARPNVDPATGIHFGCIPCNQLSDTWQEWLVTQLERTFDDGLELEYEGYRVAVYADSTLIVMSSPFVTHARKCSPCVPNAGDLTAPCASSQRGVVAYCPGHEAFASRMAPYEVRALKTGERILSLQLPSVCPPCGGLGKRYLAELAELQDVTVEELVRKLAADNVPLLAELPLEGLAHTTGTCQCPRCKGHGLILERVIGTRQELLARIGGLLFTAAPVFKAAADALYSVTREASVESRLQCDQLIRILRAVSATYETLLEDPSDGQKAQG